MKRHRGRGAGSGTEVLNNSDNSRLSLWIKVTGAITAHSENSRRYRYTGQPEKSRVTIKIDLDSLTTADPKLTRSSEDPDSLT